MRRILFICHGNICRSTMAESVFHYMVEKANVQDEVIISSSGTSREEIGNPVHYGTVDVLNKHDIPVVAHKAKQITLQEIEAYDFLICMDDRNITNLKRIAPSKYHYKISKLLSYAGSDRNIADPWYSGDFETTFQDVWEGCLHLFDEVFTDRCI